jgi:hypothetical protein
MRSSTFHPLEFSGDVALARRRDDHDDHDDAGSIAATIAIRQSPRLPQLHPQLSR